jgi:hypothetical protein
MAREMPHPGRELTRHSHWWRERRRHQALGGLGWTGRRARPAKRVAAEDAPVQLLQVNSWISA